MLITQRSSTVPDDRELERVRAKLLRVPDSPEHTLILLRAARLLEPEMDYDQMKLEYNRVEPAQRDEWVAKVAESLDKYEATLEAERNA